MKFASYWCDKCIEPQEFNHEDVRKEYLCPKCGEKMWYWETYEIDPLTDKVISRCIEPDRKAQSPPLPEPTPPQPTRPTITCPTCGSTNTRKISGLERGVSVLTLGLMSRKINKSFKCNKCGYTW